MSNQKDIFLLIKELTGQANILTIPRAFIEYTGSLDTALLLSQIIYWSDRNPQGDWFYKSYKEWFTEIGFSEYQVRRCISLLKKMGILETKVRRANGLPILHYHFLTQAFTIALLKKLKKRNLKNSRNNNIDYNRDYKREVSQDPFDLIDSISKEDDRQQAIMDADQNMLSKALKRQAGAHQ